MSNKLILLTGKDNNQLIEIFQTFLYNNQFVISVASKYPEIDIVEISRDKCATCALTHLEQKDRTNKLINEWKEGSLNAVILTHSEIVFGTLRLAIRNKVIHHENVEVHWYPIKDIDEPEVLKFNSYGRIDNWPRGFFDTYDQILADLLSR